MPPTENKTEPRPGKVTTTDLSSLWTQIDSLAKKLSHECTKFCLAYMEPPLPAPEEVEGEGTNACQ